MKHHSLFSDKSDLYEQARPCYPAELFTYLASLCRDKCAAWDAACGNGQASIGLADHFATVFATDVSKAQLSNAKPRAGVEYRVAESEDSGLPSQSVDLVCVAQALHWFDLDRFWSEVRRVLKPGGILTAFGYNFPTIEKSIDSLFKDQILNVIEPYWAPQNQLIWNGYRDIDFPFERIESPEFSMAVNWTLDQYFELIHTFSATRRCMEKQGEEFFSEAYKEAGKLWANPNSKKTIAFDFVFYVGRVK